VLKIFPVMSADTANPPLPLAARMSASPSNKPSKNPPAPTSFRQSLAQPVVASFIGGGVAGAVSRTVVSPLERLKILFQIQSVGREEYKLSVGKALGKMWKEEGWRGFMRGNGTNCVRIVPYSAVQFGSYNFYKRVGLRLPSRDRSISAKQVVVVLRGDARRGLA